MLKGTACRGMGAETVPMPQRRDEKETKTKGRRSVWRDICAYRKWKET